MQLRSDAAANHLWWFFLSCFVVCSAVLKVQIKTVSSCLPQSEQAGKLCFQCPVFARSGDSAASLGRPVFEAMWIFSEQVVGSLVKAIDRCVI